MMVEANKLMFVGNTSLIVVLMIGMLCLMKFYMIIFRGLFLATSLEAPSLQAASGTYLTLMFFLSLTLGLMGKEL